MKVIGFITSLLITAAFSQTEEEQNLIQVSDKVQQEIGKCPDLFAERDVNVCKGKEGMDLAMCENKYGNKYLNQIRDCYNVKKGSNVLGKCMAGTMGMLDNALAHSRAQENSGERGLFHQSLGAARFGSGDCQRTGLNGENVAYHWSGSETKTWQSVNAAWFCVVYQWLNSDGHRVNMLRPSFQTAVVGITYKVFGGRKRVTCTQTFLSSPPKISNSPPSCRNSEGGAVNSAPSVSPTSTSTPSPSATPIRSGSGTPVDDTKPTVTPTRSKTPTPSNQKRYRCGDLNLVYNETRMLYCVVEDTSRCAPGIYNRYIEQNCDRVS